MDLISNPSRRGLAAHVLPVVQPAFARSCMQDHHLVNSAEF
jgi:hypothetical protein